MIRALLVVLMSSLAGCPGAHSGYPTTRCTVTADCYENETCVLSGENGTCMPTEATSGSDGGNP